MDFGALLNEFMGSFFLTTGGFMVGSTSVYSALAIGVGYAALRQAFRKSRAHFNPSISVAELIKGTIGGVDFGLYLGGQLLGSLLGGLIAAQLAKDDLKAGTSIVHPTVQGDHSSFEGLIVEILFTFLFVLVVMMSGRKVGDNLLTGFALFAALMFSTGISGGSLNLTDTLGRYIGSSTVDTAKDVKYDDIWVYIVGPALGGALAAGYSMVAERVGEDADEEKPLKESAQPSV